MKRRAFLKGMLALGASAAIPVSLVPGPVSEIATRETVSYTQADVDDMLAQLFKEHYAKFAEAIYNAPNPMFERLGRYNKFSFTGRTSSSPISGRYIA